jgi:phosphohistidine phosphatase
MTFACEGVKKSAHLVSDLSKAGVIDRQCTVSSACAVCLCREWLHKALQDGQAAAPSGFHIPGEYSLAYRLLTGWLGPSSSANGNGSSLSSPSSSSSHWIGDQVPQADIDTGVFKYILMRLTDSRDSSRSKLLVRGSCAAAYHNHVLQHTKAHIHHLAPEGHLQLQVLGGGRIEHYPEQQVISVYGYSAAFGPAVHEVTAGLLKKWHPFSNITWSYEGY